MNRPRSGWLSCRMYGRPNRSANFATVSATSRQSCSDSIAHGPAMRKNSPPSMRFIVPFMPARNINRASVKASGNSAGHQREHPGEPQRLPSGPGYFFLSEGFSTVFFFFFGFLDSRFLLSFPLAISASSRLPHQETTYSPWMQIDNGPYSNRQFRPIMYEKPPVTTEQR